MTGRDMTKSSAVGVAILALTVGVGLTGCGSNSESEKTSTSTSTSISSAAPTTSAQASGPNETIADYIKQNDIQESTVTHSTPGAPKIDLPVPEGWSQIPENPGAPYGGIVFDAPAAPNDPPKVLAILSRLTGDVDTDKLLSHAPGEIKNLPGFDGGDGEKDSLSGFPAYQVGGMYTKDGVNRLVAQKTVVIQGNGAVYVLQLNAEGPEADANALLDATSAIDEKTTITP
ncbi:MAG: LpqN/LpqT family lipoprotein [Mycobacterium sp.]